MFIEAFEIGEHNVSIVGVRKGTSFHVTSFILGFVDEIRMVGRLKNIGRFVDSFHREVSFQFQTWNNIPFHTEIIYKIVVNGFIYRIQCRVIHRIRYFGTTGTRIVVIKHYLFQLSIVIVRIEISIHISVIAKRAVRRVGRSNLIISYFVTETQVLIIILQLDARTQPFAVGTFHYTRGSIVIQVHAITETIVTSFQLDAVLVADTYRFQRFGQPVGIIPSGY